MQQTSSMCRSVLTLCALSASAAAFAPTEHVHLGIEPDRIMRYHPQEQVRLLRSPAWKQFVETEGADWLARFDERTGVPFRMWGAGIPVPVSDGPGVEAWVRSFIGRHAELLGANPSALLARNVNYSEHQDTWYVEFDVIERGAPVWRGGITAYIKHGNLVMVGARTYPDIAKNGRARLNVEAALDIAREHGPEPFAWHSEESGRLVWLPEENDGLLSLRLCWETRSRTLDPAGIWVSFVDAETGELVNVHNEVRYFDAQLLAEHDTRTVNGDFSVSPLPYAGIADEGRYADADGFVSASDSAAATLNGSYLRVFNENGGDASFSIQEGENIFTAEDATQAELDNYVFLHHVKAWGEQYSPEIGMVASDLRSYVNLDSTCNAYYDGNVNFYRSGGGCNNTGRIADVNYHEWGHGFHYTSLQSGSYDGSMGEGIADVVAFIQTQDFIIAPYFQTNGNGIRNVSRNRVYPDDIVNQVHTDGLIFGGAMWDFMQLLIEAEGVEYAADATSVVLAGLVKSGPTIPESFDAAVLGDDDNGDLSDGTPHYCELIEAFEDHGLGPSGTGGVLLADHETFEALPVGDDHAIDVSLVNFAPECTDATPTNARVRYRLNGSSSWQTIEAEITGLDVRGMIPEQPFGTFVEYTISVDTEDGASVEVPQGSYRNPFSFYVGDVIPIQCDDFEADDGGYTSELVSGANEEGANDWQWGTPRGAANDPVGGHDSERAWGNDLGIGNYNGEYQNEKHNRLTTPEYELEHYEGVFLTYWRWLNVEDGFYDKANILADGDVVWTNYNGLSDEGGQHHQDRQWVAHSVDLGPATDDGRVSVSWEIISDQGLALGGWNIDDVCIHAPATANNRLGITDFQATDGEDGGVTLSWTNPKHAPLARVVVVRSENGYPQSPTDGIVIFDDVTPNLEEGVSVRDDEVANDVEYFYTVFGGDGTEYLGWVREGWNADMGSAVGMPEIVEDDDLEFTRGGCSCSVGAAVNPAMGWGALALLGLAGLRRRRR